MVLIYIQPLISFFDGQFAISWQTNFASQAYELSLQQDGNITCKRKSAVPRQAISSPGQGFKGVGEWRCAYRIIPVYLEHY